MALAIGYRAMEQGNDWVTSNRKVIG